MHVSQVHKDTLHKVDNALPNREDPGIEIFGMVGIPDEIMQQHKARITQQYWENRAEREVQTGNPAPGTKEGVPRRRRKPLPSKEELKRDVRNFIAKKRAAEQDGTTMSPGEAPTARDVSPEETATNETQPAPMGPPPGIPHEDPAPPPGLELPVPPQNPPAAAALESNPAGKLVDFEQLIHLKMCDLLTPE